MFPTTGLLGTTGHGPLLFTLIVLTGIASGLLAAVALIAVSRRQSIPYLLVALALVFLAAKAGVGLLHLSGTLGHVNHNFLEHTLDFVVATLLVMALVEARGPSDCHLCRWVGMHSE
jgi:hypothetical protein